MIGKVASGGFAALFIALAVYAWGQSQRLDSAKARIDALTTQLEAARGANRSNLATIADLQEANLAWASAMRAAEDETERLRMERENARQLAAEAAAAEQAARQELYRHDPSAAAWAAARVPDAVLRRLREYPAGH